MTLEARIADALAALEAERDAGPRGRTPYGNNSLLCGCGWDSGPYTQPCEKHIGDLYEGEIELVIRRLVAEGVLAMCDEEQA